MSFDGRLLTGVSVLSAVVEGGSFVRAADALGITASGVSRAIARLEARVAIEEWRCEYNTVRPHSALGGLSPEEFRNGVAKPRGLARSGEIEQKSNLSESVA